jgi:hypothetical protein
MMACMARGPRNVGHSKYPERPWSQRNGAGLAAIVIAVVGTIFLSDYLYNTEQYIMLAFLLGIAIFGLSFIFYFIISAWSFQRQLDNDITIKE